MVLKIDGYGTEALKERYRCMTDLFYFATEYLGYDLTEKVHRPVCDFFIQKNPALPIEEWDLIKDRLLIDPREHYKTTIDVADMIQSIICFPNIRIAIFSGTEDLAKQIMLMAQRHFQLNDKFKELFPEHAVPRGKNLSVFSFTTPARDDWRLREETLTVSTIMSVSTGGHYNEIRYDDIVVPQNSENAEQLQKTKDRVKSTIPLVVAGGYRYFIGTVYDHSDVYGEIIDNLEEDRVVVNIPFGSVTYTSHWKVFNRKACSLPFTKESEILFTENRLGKKQFNYRELNKRLKEMGARQFGCQYLNDAMWGETSTFSEELLQSCLIPAERIPLITKNRFTDQIYKSAVVFQAWDTAYSLKEQANRTCGVAGAFDKFGKLYILDMEVGKFTPDEFILKFVGMIQRWYPFMGRVGIEEAAGAPLAGPSLRLAQASANVQLPIDWLPTSPKRVKSNRIFSMIPLMKNGKLFINKDMKNLDELLLEFTRYPRYKTDDIPDACSMLLGYQANIDIFVPYLEEQQKLETFEPNPLGFGYAY